MEKNMNNLPETDRTAIQMMQDYGAAVACRGAVSNIKMFTCNRVERERWTKIYNHLIIMRNKTFHS